MKVEWVIPCRYAEVRGINHNRYIIGVQGFF